MEGEVIEQASHRRWEQVRLNQGLRCDSEVAAFLLQHYEDTLSGFQSSVQCRQCKTPLILRCPVCSSQCQDLKVEPRVANATLVDTSAHVDPDDTANFMPSSTASDTSMDSGVNSGETALLEIKTENTGVDETPLSLSPGLNVDRNVGDNVSEARGIHRQRSIKSTVPVMEIVKSGGTRNNSGRKQLTVKLRRIEDTAVVEESPAHHQKHRRQQAGRKKQCKKKGPTARQLKKATQKQDQTPCQSLPPAQTTQHLQPSSQTNLQLFRLQTVLPQGENEEKGEQSEPTIAASQEGDDKRSSMRIMEGSKQPKLCKEEQADVTRELISLVQRSQCGTPEYKQTLRLFTRGYSGFCPICQRRIKALSKHLTNHMPQKVVPCPLCPMTFRNVAARDYHRERVHSSRGKSFTCEDCGRSFYKPWLLQQHLRIHTGEKPYVCDKCGAAFSSSPGLINHNTSTHIGKKPFTCEDCGKTYAFISLLKRHRAAHSTTAQFPCTLCLRAFVSKRLLNQHMVRHKAARSHVCDVCGRGFKTRWQVNKHVSVHSEERPYRCDFCGKGFKMRSVLDTHRRVHTGERPYKCPDCDKSFSDSGNLCKHRKTNHRWPGVEKLAVV